MCLLDLHQANLKNIFVYAYPTPFYWYGSVGWNFFLTSQIGYSLNLITYSKTCLKRPLNKIQKNVFSRPIIAYNAGQKYCTMLPNDLCCVYL